MIVIRAPLRVSLFGGGTDLDPYCSQYGSTIISFAINRYIYLTWNDRPTGGCRLSYSEVEELDRLADAKHTLVAEAARQYHIQQPCTLTIVSDVPKGTGLGSSSALAVCLMLMVHPNTGGWAWIDLVRRSAALEHSISKAGWQDYLPATYGEFNIYRISPGGIEMTAMEGFMNHVDVVAPCFIDLINTHGLLLYTGGTRAADPILANWQKSETELHKIKALADEVAGQIDRLNVTSLAQYLNATWLLKREISGVTDPMLNEQYGLAIASGAYGGKLLGAGSKGCWFFLVSPEKRQRVIDALGLTEIPFQIAEKGVEMWEL